MKLFEDDSYAYTEEIIDSSYNVKVIHCNLRKRANASFDSNIIGNITDMGVYTIIEEFDGWGKLEDGSWINLKFTEKI